MKTLILNCLAALLLLPVTATAQDNGQPRNGAKATAVKAVNISGTVSLDGKTLVTDADNMWTISNADALKGHEGQHLTVKCQTDPDKRAIHVLFIKPEPAGMKQAANWGDSAFRR